MTYAGEKCNALCLQPHGTLRRVLQEQKLTILMLFGTTIFVISIRIRNFLLLQTSSFGSLGELFFYYGIGKYSLGCVIWLHLILELVNNVVHPQSLR